MFCPKCGKSEQSAETYCRQCGVFLPDLSKPLKSPRPPEEHIKANTVLSAMTIIASFTLAILLYSILGFRPTTHPLIYVTAGLLIAMGIWHIQTLWRTLLLKKHLKENKRPSTAELGGAEITGKLLAEPDFENTVPASVTDRTTRHLAEAEIKRSSQP